MNTSTFVSQFEIPIRWSDHDAYNHVSNTKYFEYMSEARIKYLEEHFLNSTIQFVVAETHCIYKKPLEYPGIILLKIFIEKIGSSHIIFRFDFHLAGDESNFLYATGKAKIVCFDPNKKRITRIPTNISNKLKLHFVPAASGGV